MNSWIVRYILSDVQNHVEIDEQFFIGDSNTDMKAAEAAGCKGILLKKDQKLIDTVNQIF